MPFNSLPDDTVHHGLVPFLATGDIVAMRSVSRTACASVRHRWVRVTLSSRLLARNPRVVGCAVADCATQPGRVLDMMQVRSSRLSRTPYCTVCQNLYCDRQFVPSRGVVLHP